MTGSGAVPFVGRERELARLQEALTGAAEGRPRGVLVAGEAGLGKSRLVRALCDLAPADALLLRSQCVDLGDPGLPFLVVTDLLRALRVRAETDEGVSAALGRVPVLAELSGPAGDAGVGLDESGRLRVLDAAATLLGDLGREGGPVVVTVEDLQWVDASSAAFLTFLLSRVTSERLLVVATVRTDGLAAHAAARRLVGELTRLPAVQRLELSPFGLGEVADYLAQVGAADDPSGEVAEDVLRRTGGNPYFVATLADDVVRGGRPGEGLPRALADLLAGRLATLPDAARDVVRCTAISSQPVSHRMLQRVSGLDDAHLDPGLRAAVAQGVLVPDGPGYRVAHELLRTAVLDDLLPGERARLHAARAAGLVAGVDGPAVAAEVAHHAAEAGEHAEVLEWSVRAAEEALRVQAPGEALRHLERALATWPGVATDRREGLREGRIAVQASRAAGLAGEPGKGVELARRGVRLCDADADAPGGVQARAELARRLVEVDAVEDAVGPATEAVRLAGEHGVEPGPTALAEVSLARALLLARRPGARAAADRGLSSARAAGEAGLEVEALTTTAFLDELDGDRAAAADRLGAATRQARAAGEQLGELRAYYALASLHYYGGDVAVALPVLETAMQRVAESGLRWSEPGVELRVLHAVALYVSGDLEGSRAAADAPESPPPDVAAARLAAVSCYSAVALGSADAADRLERLRDSWDADPQVGLVAGGCEADLLTWQGAPDAAVEAAARAQDHLDRAAGEGAYGGLWLSALALAALADRAEAARAQRDGRAETEAVARGAALREHVQRLVAGGRGRPGALGPEGLAWQARAMAEHARLAGSPAVEEWRAAVQAFGYGHAYEQARCRWRLSAALVTAGDREGARSAAREAAEAAARMGARPLQQAVAAAVARDRLAAGTGPGVLTDREREVLALVAEGLSNREIGTRLFISAKTASVHLSNLMAKLNASSRTEAVTVARRRGLIDLT